jgi:DNA-binding NarL/FixJ family response regulator
MTPGVRTVVVCDDHKNPLDAISLLISHFPRFRLVGRAVDGITCLQLLAETRANILITDIGMPGGGTALLSGARAKLPDLHIVVYSGRDDDALRQQMLHAGANVFVLKTGRLQPLLDAVDHDAVHRSTAGAAEVRR